MKKFRNILTFLSILFGFIVLISFISNDIKADENKDITIDYQKEIIKFKDNSFFKVENNQESTYYQLTEKDFGSKLKIKKDNLDFELEIPKRPKINKDTINENIFYYGKSGTLLTLEEIKNTLYFYDKVYKIQLATNNSFKSLPIFENIKTEIQDAEYIFNNLTSFTELNKNDFNLTVKFSVFNFSNIKKYIKPNSIIIKNNSIDVENNKIEFIYKNQKFSKNFDVKKLIFSLPNKNNLINYLLLDKDIKKYLDIKRNVNDGKAIYKIKLKDLNNTTWSDSTKNNQEITVEYILNEENVLLKKFLLNNSKGGKETYIYYIIITLMLIMIIYTIIRMFSKKYGKPPLKK